MFPFFDPLWFKLHFYHKKCLQFSGLTRYKKPANWINDGLTACYYCNVDLDWFEQRYLAKTTTENKPEVLAAYLELRDDMG
jgi:hypothetical protein